ncbi:MAG TPA: O-antigen ligase family protein [Gaiellaceae bacterium]|nr:O-antigen ligase family protein [Gaiellaceae bacterium]
MPLEAEMGARAASRASVAHSGTLTLGAAVFAAALPVLFLHAHFQPGFSVSVSSTKLDLRLSDLAVLIVGAAALVEGLRHGFSPLRRGLPIWIAAGAFLVFVVAASFYPLASDSLYPWKTHLVTAVKYAEYALLAPAVPLLLRRRSDVTVVIGALILCSAAATVAGLAQFFGARILAAWPSGGRQPSFVGVDDFGLLSAAAFTAAVAIVALGPQSQVERRLAWIGAVAGCLGAIVSGALASILGIGLAAGAAALVAWHWHALSLRRGLALGLMVCAVVVGGIFMRSTALGHFANFLGLGKETQTGQVESYSHRWVLDYVGLRIFLRHPVLGAGWQGGFDPETYGPVLPAAHRRFPAQPALAFPSPQHPWGIQNAYVEALAELGVVGFLIFAAWIATGLATSLRTLLRARPAALQPAMLGLLWILLSAGVWNGLWFIAGIPFDTLIWLGFGLAGAGVVAASTRA